MKKSREFGCSESPPVSGGKSQVILEALAHGLSFEQILAANLSMSYHDIFHAAAESIADETLMVGAGLSLRPD